MTPDLHLRDNKHPTTLWSLVSLQHGSVAKRSRQGRIGALDIEIGKEAGAVLVGQLMTLLGVSPPAVCTGRTAVSILCCVFEY